MKHSALFSAPSAPLRETLLSVLLLLCLFAAIPSGAHASTTNLPSPSAIALMVDTNWAIVGPTNAAALAAAFRAANGIPGTNDTATLSNRVDEIELDLPAITTRLDDIEGDLPAITTRLDDIEGDLPAITTRLDGIESGTGVLTGMVAAISGATGTAVWAIEQMPDVVVTQDMPALRLAGPLNMTSNGVTNVASVYLIGPGLLVTNAAGTTANPDVTGYYAMTGQQDGTNTYTQVGGAGATLSQGGEGQGRTWAISPGGPYWLSADDIFTDVPPLGEFTATSECTGTVYVVVSSNYLLTAQTLYDLTADIASAAGVFPAASNAFAAGLEARWEADGVVRTQALYAILSAEIDSDVTLGTGDLHTVVSAEIDADIVIATNAVRAESARLASTLYEPSVTEGSLGDSSVVSADIKDSTLVEADMSVDNAPADEDILTYESGTGNFEWHSMAEMGDSRYVNADGDTMEEDLAFGGTNSIKDVQTVGFAGPPFEGTSTDATISGTSVCWVSWGFYTNATADPNNASGVWSTAQSPQLHLFFNNYQQVWFVNRTVDEGDLSIDGDFTGSGGGSAGTYTAVGAGAATGTVTIATWTHGDQRHEATDTYRARRAGPTLYEDGANGRIGLRTNAPGATLHTYHATVGPVAITELGTAGANEKIHSWRLGGVEKAYLDEDGDLWAIAHKAGSSSFISGLLTLYTSGAPAILLNDSGPGEGNWTFAANADDLYGAVDADAAAAGEVFRFFGADGSLGLVGQNTQAVVHAGYFCLVGFTNANGSGSTALGFAVDGSGLAYQITGHDPVTGKRYEYVIDPFSGTETVFYIEEWEDDCVDAGTMLSKAEYTVVRDSPLTIHPEKPTAQARWNADQQDRVAERKAQIDNWQSNTNSIKVKGPCPAAHVQRACPGRLRPGAQGRRVAKTTHVPQAAKTTGGGAAGAAGVLALREMVAALRRRRRGGVA